MFDVHVGEVRTRHAYRPFCKGTWSRVRGCNLVNVRFCNVSIVQHRSCPIRFQPERVKHFDLIVLEVQPKIGTVNNRFNPAMCQIEHNQGIFHRLSLFYKLKTH